VTLDDHGTHTEPYLFVAETSPRYAAVCGPHEGNRWGEWAPFVPLEPDPDRYAPEAIAARREYYRLHPERATKSFIDGVYAGRLRKWASTDGVRSCESTSQSPHSGASSMKADR